MSRIDVRQAGKLGGLARAKKLSKERRREIAIKASLAAKQAREDNHAKKSGEQTN